MFTTVLHYIIYTIFTINSFYVIVLLRGCDAMDNEWLTYWQDIEDLGTIEENSDSNDAFENEKQLDLEQAQDLYKTVLIEKN